MMKYIGLNSKFDSSTSLTSGRVVELSTREVKAGMNKDKSGHYDHSSHVFELQHILNGSEEPGHCQHRSQPHNIVNIKCVFLKTSDHKAL